MENMENTTAALEITSTQLKLVIGYVYEGKVVVLYALTRPIPNTIEAGNIIDAQNLISEIKDISHIKDSNVKLRIGFKEALLILPPLGLDVYQAQKTTNVVAPSGIIDRVDIYNVALQVGNENVLNKNNCLIDVVPTKFYLDQGRQFIKPPLGEKTTTLTADELAYTLPSKVSQDYRRILLASNIKVKREFAAPFASAELIDSYQLKHLNGGYLYVDIGSHITSVSVIYKNLCYASSFFLKGGDDVTFDIMNSFKVSFAEAEKIKRRLGYATRATDIDPIVLNSDDEDKTGFKLSEYNMLMRKNLDDFLYDLKNCISSLFKTYENPENYINMPIVIGGGGARLIGLIDYLKKALPNQKSVETIIPTSIGARSQSYINCLGAILANSTYRGTLEENKLNVTQVNRNEETTTDKKDNNIKNSETHDEL